MEGCVAIEAYRLGKTLFEEPTLGDRGLGEFTPGKLATGSLG